MAKTGWERFADYSDDGYYSDPLTLREDIDSGAATHIARMRERENVVAFLRREADQCLTDEEVHTLLFAASDIEAGRHYDR